MGRKGGREGREGGREGREGLQLEEEGRTEVNREKERTRGRDDFT